MTVATYSSIAPLQGKRISHGDVIDRLLVLWPAAAVTTGAVLLWLFGLAVGAAIAFGLLAGCAVALVWTFATVPLARVRDGLTSYTADKAEEPKKPEPAQRAPGLISQHEIMYLIASYHR